MCSKVSDFIKNIHSITLPSSLWAFHIDPKEEFIAILHVSVTCDKITIDKGVLLTCENSLLKASVSLNDEIVQIPNITSKVETISDLTALIYNLHDIKFCLNVNCLEFPECSKYVTSTESNFCDNCAFEAFTEKEDANKIQSSAFLDSINFNEPLVLQEDEDLQSYEFPPKKHTKIKEKQKKFLCTVCGKTFSCVSELKIHTIIHGDDKPFKCNICTKSFAKKYNLNVHSRVHTGERPYVCSKCGKTYSTRSNLSTHMNSAHCKEKRHPCDICKMTFVHPRLLKIHMRKHTGEKPFMCQVCGKAFSKNIHLTIHTRTHTGEKPYVCPVCGKGFTTSGNLNSHKKINHT